MENSYVNVIICYVSHLHNAAITDQSITAQNWTVIFTWNSFCI